MKTGRSLWRAAPLVALALGIAATALAGKPKPTMKKQAVAQTDAKMLKLAGTKVQLTTASKIPPAPKSSLSMKASKMQVPSSSVLGPIRFSAARAMIPNRGFLNSYQMDFYPDRDLLMATNGGSSPAVVLNLTHLTVNKRHLVECEVRAPAGATTVELRTQGNVLTTAQTLTPVPNKSSRLLSVVFTPFKSDVPLTLAATPGSAWVMTYCEVTPQS